MTEHLGKLLHFPRRLTPEAESALIQELADKEMEVNQLRRKLGYSAIEWSEIE